MSLSSLSLQERTLCTFAILHELSEDWRGELILACGLGPGGAALSLASHIAGALCLALEPDPAVAHQALRTGTCDFVVNSLDEALRTLKNEARKRSPLSVGLLGTPATLLPSLSSRGLAPKIFVDFTASSKSFVQSVEEFAGLIIVDFNQALSQNEANELGVVSADTLLETILKQHSWHLESFSQSSTSTLRAFDTRALALISGEDKLRRRWLQSAPKILPRELPLNRSLFLTSEESAYLALVRQSSAS